MTVCVKCGAEFRVPPSRADRKFCSQVCAGNAPSQARAKCVTCGRAFRAKPARIADGRARYCSLPCKHAGQSVRMTGARNPAHIDGGTRVRKAAKHAERRAAIKAFDVSPRDLERIRDRQAGKCAICACSLFVNGEHIDHITPLALGGRHSIGNLQLLCVECNLKKGDRPMAALRYRNAGPTEDVEQEMVLRWAEGQVEVWPELAMLCHIPNGGYRSKRAGAQMKRLGVKPGVPDMMLPVSRGGYHGLFIEMKRKTGGTVSKEQRAWIDHLNREGFLAVVCKGYEEAVDTLRDYLAGDGPNEGGAK